MKIIFILLLSGMNRFALYSLMLIAFSVTPSPLGTMSCDPEGPVSQFNTLSDNNLIIGQGIKITNLNTSHPPIDGIITVILWVA